MRPQHLRLLLRRRGIPARTPQLLLTTTTTATAPAPRCPAAAAPSRSFQMPTLFKPKPTWGPDLSPGLPAMKRLVKHLDEKIGSAPSRPDLQESFKAFVTYTIPENCHDDIVDILSRTYNYLRDHWLEQKQSGEMVTDRHGVKRLVGGHLPVQRYVLGELLMLLKDGNPKQLELARMVVRDIFTSEGTLPTHTEMHPYVLALCNAGEVDEACAFVREWAPKMESEIHAWKAWDSVLLAVAKRDDEAALLRIIADMRPLVNGIERRQRRLYFMLISFYCKQDNMGKVKECYEAAVAEGGAVTLPTLVVIVKACMRNNELELGQELFATLLKQAEEHPTMGMRKEAWDIALQLLAAVSPQTNKTVELLSKMKERAAAGGVEAPDATTITSILTAAVPAHDTALVSACLDYSTKNNLRPSLETLELLLTHHITASNIPAAVDTFAELKFTQDIPKAYPARESQHLLQTLCAQSPPDLQLISELYADLQSWGVRLATPSIVALIRAFLTGPHFVDIKTVIARHVGLISADDKYLIIDELVSYIHAPTTSIEAAYDTYLHLARLLPQLTLTDRERIMNTFFELGQPLMASKVLVDMSLTPERHPTKYQYTAAFMGIAYNPNVQALMEIKRTMNMDPHLTPDTVLRNAHMQACNMCGLTLKALYVYDEIVSSNEGPDSATISIVFDVCARDEYSGLHRARKIWLKCKENSVPLTPNNVASYVECLARHQQWSDSWEVVKTLEEKMGVRPDAKM